MPRRRITPNQIRNSVFGEEEIESLISEVSETDSLKASEYRERLSNDYKLDDLNANDDLALNDLCRMYVGLDKLQILWDSKMIQDSPDAFEIEKISKVMAQLRDSISKIQTDLGITRKLRKSDKETSTVDFIEYLKKKAKKEYDRRLSYIYCPECKLLLATVWFLTPDSGNSMTLTCGRKIGDKTCGHRFMVGAKELIEKGNKNLDDVLDT